MRNDTKTPYLKTLAMCISKLTQAGYTEHFKATDLGFAAIHSNHIYKPEDVHIINFFRFGSNEDAQQEKVMYVIEAEDGVKGVLVDDEQRLSISELK